jgi:hypothetical protein
VPATGEYVTCVFSGLTVTLSNFKGKKTGFVEFKIKAKNPEKVKTTDFTIKTMTKANVLID